MPYYLIYYQLDLEVHRLEVVVCLPIVGRRRNDCAVVLLCSFLHHSPGGVSSPQALRLVVLFEKRFVPSVQPSLATLQKAQLNRQPSGDINGWVLVLISIFFVLCVPAAQRSRQIPCMESALCRPCLINVFDRFRSFFFNLQSLISFFTTLYFKPSG